MDRVSDRLGHGETGLPLTTTNAPNGLVRCAPGSAPQPAGRAPTLGRCRCERVNHVALGSFLAETLLSEERALLPFLGLAFVVASFLGVALAATLLILLAFPISFDRIGLPAPFFSSSRFRNSLSCENGQSLPFRQLPWSRKPQQIP